MNFMNRIAIVCVVFFIIPNVFASEVWNISKLFSQIASHDSLRYKYVETKYMSFLQDPMRSRGILIFKNPDVLQKHVTYPRLDKYNIIGDRLIIDRQNKRKREVSLSNYPELLALAESMRATLSGKYTVLKKYYNLELKGNRLSWKLILTPTDIDLIEIIEFVEIRGQNGFLQQVVIKEVNGDRSVLDLLVSGKNNGLNGKKTVHKHKDKTGFLNQLQSWRPAVMFSTVNSAAGFSGLTAEYL